MASLRILPVTIFCLLALAVAPASAEPTSRMVTVGVRGNVEATLYVPDGPGPFPSIVVIHDLDGEDAGYGAFWGEVQSNVHKALGCLGTITNGSIRDIPMIPEGFQMLAGSIGLFDSRLTSTSSALASFRYRLFGKSFTIASIVLSASGRCPSLFWAYAFQYIAASAFAPLRSITRSKLAIARSQRAESSADCPWS